jgi:hypothetical protein
MLFAMPHHLAMYAVYIIGTSYIMQYKDEIYFRAKHFNTMLYRDSLFERYPVAEIVLLGFE